MSGAERPPHAVLVRSPAGFGPAAVAAVIAKRSGAVPLDVLPVVRRGWGVAAESLPAADAEALAAELTAAGQSSLAVPTTLLETPAAPALVAKAELVDAGFGVLAGPENLEPERLAWARLAGLCAAGLEIRTTTTTTESGPGQMAAKAVRLGLTLATGLPLPMGGGEEKKRVIETRDRVLVLDLLFVEPARSLRIESARFDYSLLGARMGYSAESNFARLLADLAERAPKALRGKGTRAILDRRRAAESAYESLDDLRREERWLLTLVALRAAL